VSLIIVYIPVITVHLFETLGFTLLDIANFIYVFCQMILK